MRHLTQVTISLTCHALPVPLTRSIDNALSPRFNPDSSPTTQSHNFAGNLNIEYFDAMELSSPFRSSPYTPKPRARNLNTPSPPYKSKATVISLDSSPVGGINAHDIEDRMHDYLSRQQEQYNDNDSDVTQMPDLTEYSHPPNAPTRTSHANVTPIKPLRLRTFTRRESGNENAFSQALGHMLLWPPTANPPITVLLVLTPRPASLAETTAFEAFGPRFCSDFEGSGGQDWSCISLYAHFRKWATAQEFKSVNALNIRDEDDIDIGGIHPYALRAKLEQEKEVQWRLAVPVLKTLIDGEVKKGSRAFVICGLAVGDVEGVRAFGRTVSSNIICLDRSEFRETDIASSTEYGILTHEPK